MILANIHGRLHQSTGEDLQSLGVAILQNITVEPLEAYLRFEALDAGLSVAVPFGRFDAILQQAAHKDDLIWVESIALIAQGWPSQSVYGRYVPSPNNALVRDFLGNSGFDLALELDGELLYARDKGVT